jgi:hypothetical protein
MSDRLATSRRDISQYHISLLDAHTLLAQASLAVLLRDPDVNGHADSGVLAGYAAEHWTTHARVENVASQLRDGMEDLFDPEKPYFEAWVQLHDIDPKDHGDFPNVPDSERGARPLYYAAFCGFEGLVEHLTLKYPQYASAQRRSVRYCITLGIVRRASPGCPVSASAWCRCQCPRLRERHAGATSVMEGALWRRSSVCSSMAQMWICRISSTMPR